MDNQHLASEIDELLLGVNDWTMPIFVPHEDHV